VKSRIHRIPGISEIADQRMQKLNLRKVLKEKKVEDQKVSQLLQVSRATLYRWQKQLKVNGIKGLEDKSRRPHKVRKSLWWGTKMMEAVVDLRVQYPGWGKDKLAILLHHQGMNVSSSTIGRILTDMKRIGVLRTKPKSFVKRNKRIRNRFYAVQKSKEYVAELPGDLVQVDTMKVRLFEGRCVRHFTAQDVISRWNVLEIHKRATTHTASKFLETLMSRMPFPVKAIQVDGGGEYCGEFERACQRSGVKLFVLPPHSPRLNGRVERAHRTHLDEFYAVTSKMGQMEKLKSDLYQWEYVYNNIRPHQALHYLSPVEYLNEYYPHLIAKESQV